MKYGETVNAQQKLIKELEKNDVHWDAYEEVYQDAIDDIEYRLKLSGLTLHFNKDNLKEHPVRKHL